MEKIVQIYYDDFDAVLAPMLQQDSKVCTDAVPNTGL